ncbi:hypothetical protein [Aestuariivivens marinum]|uniref:hypothetical protein n=1 Tax=Aestuariivivens marinum TaxID=2913555 RepID=UPI001F58F1BE|nr:hypothetical protein [Aestuariivivens marinum]
MIKKFLKYTLPLIIFCLFMSSCTKQVDFNQANDLVLEPIVASDLIFFNADATEFFVDNTELVTVRDSVIIDLFNRDFFVDYVVKAEFVFKVINSINRSSNVTIEFFDINNQKRHGFSLMALASPNNTDIITTHTEIFENQALDDLKASNKVVLTMQVLAGGDPLNDNTPGRVELKSKGLFYTSIDVSE